MNARYLNNDKDTIIDKILIPEESNEQEHNSKDYLKNEVNSNPEKNQSLFDSNGSEADKSKSKSKFVMMSRKRRYYNKIKKQNRQKMEE